MHMILKFDKNSPVWCEDFEYNELYVRAQTMHIKDFYKVHGYMYLETIYSMFYLKWDPYNENVCWVLKRDGELNISTKCSCNEIIIDILHD